MSLESATHIADLNTSNPVGSTDKVQTLDDHIRLIKSVLKTDLNLTAPVTATAAELNILDGATLSTAELNILDGVTLTAAQINDAAQKSATQIISGAWTFTANPTLSHTANPALTITDSDHSVSVVVQASGGGGEAKIGTTTSHFLSFYTNNVARYAISNGGNHDFLSGTVTTSNASASEVGFKGAPQNAQNGDYTLALTDCGKTIYKASGGAGETITIPANSGGVAFPVGTIIRIVNNGGGDLTIAITSDTLSLAGVGTTGSRTLSDHGVAVIEKVASTEWFISGVGLS